MKIIFGVVGVLVAGWVLYSWLSVRGIEEPAYEVTSVAAGYELRTYEPYIVAEVTVGGAYSDGLNDGFRQVADYIFGNNTSASKIAMTAPVLEADISEKIAMTVPVLDETNATDETRTVAFVMPSQYTMETLPQPNNDAVTLRQVPARTMAVARVWWYGTDERMGRREAELRAALIRDGLTATGPAARAFYNPPGTIPFLLRNEVLILVE